MVKTRLVALSLCVSIFLLPIATQADDGAPKWGSSGSGSAEQMMRTSLKGSNGYYEPDKLERDVETIRFKVYAAAEMADKRVLEEVAINCNTREMARLKSDSATNKTQWEAPVKLFAGDALYATARELCAWGPGFWKRLAD